MSEYLQRQRDIEARFAAFDRYWLRAGLPLALAAIYLYLVTQGGPLLHNGLGDLTEVTAGLFGTLVVGLGVFLLNTLLGLPYVHRRVALELKGEATAIGPLHRLPNPIAYDDMLPLPPEGTFRGGSFYSTLLVVAAISFTILPTVFAVHGLGKVVTDGELWNRDDFRRKLELYPQGDQSLHAWVRELDTEVLTASIATPLERFECGTAGWYSRLSLKSVCLRCKPLNQQPGKFWLASFRDDILRAEVPSIRAEGLESHRKFSTRCLQNPLACVGVAVVPSPGIWYVLIGVPAMLAVASTLLFWWAVLKPTRPRTAYRKRYRDAIHSIRISAGKQPATPQPAPPLPDQASRGRRAARVLVVLIALVALWCLGTRFAGRIDLPGYFLAGTLLLVTAGPMAMEWLIRRPGMSALLIVFIVAVALSAFALAGSWAIAAAAAAVSILLLGMGLYALHRSGEARIRDSFGPQPIEVRTATSSDDATTAARLADGKTVRDLVNDLASLVGIQPPALYWLDAVAQPLALAVGRSPNGARLAVAPALLQCLREGSNEEPFKQQLKAVLAHEIAHIAHRDSTRHSIASGLNVGLEMIKRWTGRLEGPLAGRAEALLAAVLVPVLPLLGIVLRTLLTQSREFAADQAAAELVGPRAMAEALRKIQSCLELPGPMAPAPFDPELISVAHALIVPPRLPVWYGGAYDTHPPIEARIAQLERLSRTADR